MSKNETTSDASDLIIPIGRRIYEILLEKGISRYSFSQKIGWQKDTFYAVTDGKRHVPPHELEEIATGLKISTQRLQQEDTRKTAIEIRTLKQKNPKKALLLGADLLPVLLGFSEKFSVLNDMGSAHYFLKNHDDAHATWLQALPYAEKLKKHFGETEQLYKITKNLMITYSLRKDFLSLIQLLDRTGPAFAESNPERAAIISLSYAVHACQMGSMEQYKSKMYESLEYYRQSGNELSIARAIHNVAYVEFQMGNYIKSKEFFESIIGNPHHSEEDDLISIKDYVKTLYKLGEKGKALELIDSCLAQLETSSLYETKAKFLILQAVMKNSVQSAQSVLDIKGLNRNLYLSAYKFLINHFSRTGDSLRMMNYYKQAERYSSELLTNWEDV